MNSTMIEITRVHYNSMQDDIEKYEKRIAELEAENVQLTRSHKQFKKDNWVEGDDEVDEVDSWNME